MESGDQALGMKDVDGATHMAKKGFYFILFQAIHKAELHHVGFCLFVFIYFFIPNLYFFIVPGPMMAQGTSSFFDGVIRIGKSLTPCLLSQSR